ncbi:MAG: regulatory iron-sulfur-containing complex subunit RicT [Bacteroidia bacterium]|nr:regulatory iron-sulfur-containing complex subunit RicT [Bacteroidia bacterium]
MGCLTGCGCKSAGCNFLNVHDWLSDMLPPSHSEAKNIYEVSFKSTRKGFYQNVNALNITIGDYVVVESDRGYDVGKISMGGELVRLNMKKKKINPEHVLKIYRLATAEDLKKLEELRSKEMAMLVQSRAIIRSLNLEMKLSNVEFQADGTKAIFYYTAEQRVDFRELIRVLAQEFKIRVEMRQIGLRQESGLIGGIGSCGRELCCSSWLTDFKSVTTTAARYQNISLNPSKITGLCGRLKCCLNYELETYLDALKNIPDVKEIHTELGIAYLQKTDIFKNIMWFSYGGDANWVPIKVEKVIEIHRKFIEHSEIPPSLSALEDTETRNSPKEEELKDLVSTLKLTTPQEPYYENETTSAPLLQNPDSLNNSSSPINNYSSSPRKKKKRKK